MHSISHGMQSCECHRRWKCAKSAVCGRMQSSTRLRLSHLGCLSSLEWFACSPSQSFFCITPLCTRLCSAYTCRCYDCVSTGTCSQFYGLGNSTALSLSHSVSCSFCLSLAHSVCLPFFLLQLIMLQQW